MRHGDIAGRRLLKNSAAAVVMGQFDREEYGYALCLVGDLMKNT